MPQVGPTSSPDVFSRRLLPTSSPDVFYWVVVALAALVPLGSAQAQQQTYVWESVDAPVIYTAEVVLPAGTNTFAVANVSSGTRPVLHVLSPHALQPLNVQLLRAIGPGPGADFSGTFHVDAENTYLVVLRSTSTFTSGTARVEINGQLLQTPGFPPLIPQSSTLPVNGQPLAPNVSGPLVIQTAIQPRGQPAGSTYAFPSENTMVFSVDSAFNVIAIDFNGGIGNASQVWTTSTSRIFVGTTIGTGLLSGGYTNVYVNDVLIDDSDGDGLGDGLESALGTNPFCEEQNNGPDDCRRAWDTDGDGILDTHEVFGVEHPAFPGHPLELPRWGADPLTKDVFVEVNYQSTLCGATEEVGAPPVEVPLSPGNPFADGVVANFDRDAWVDEVLGYFAEGEGWRVNNPSGEDGIRVHLGLGVDPSDPTRASQYGSWGGGQMIHINRDVPNDEFFPANPSEHCPTVPAPIVLNIDSAVDCPVRGSENERNLVRTCSARFGLHPSRLGFVRHALLRPSGGGLAGVRTSAMYSSFPFSESANSNRRIGEPRMFAHELGHLLGLRHDPDEEAKFNCNPAYHSIMNYGLSRLPPVEVAGATEIVGFSRGLTDGPFNPARALEWLDGPRYNGGAWHSGYTPVAAVQVPFWSGISARPRHHFQRDPVTTPQYQDFDLNHSGTFNWEDWQRVPLNMAWNFRCDKVRGGNIHRWPPGMVNTVNVPLGASDEDTGFDHVRPALVQHGEFQYTFSIIRHDDLRYIYMVVSPVAYLSSASCSTPNGDVPGETCLTTTSVSVVPFSPTNPRQVSAVHFNGELELNIVGENNQAYAMRATSFNSSTGSVTSWSQPMPIRPQPHGEPTRLVRLPASPNRNPTDLLIAYYVRSDLPVPELRRQMAAPLSNGDLLWWFPAAVPLPHPLGQQDAPIRWDAASWDGGSLDSTVCIVARFPGDNVGANVGWLRYFCLESDSHVFSHVWSRAVDRARVAPDDMLDIPVRLSFRHHRLPGGSAFGGSVGQWWTTIVRRREDNDRAESFVTHLQSAGSTATAPFNPAAWLENQPGVRRSFRHWDENAVQGSSENQQIQDEAFEVVANSTLAAMRGLWIQEDVDDLGTRLVVAPMFDGTFQHDFEDGDDFDRMRRDTCRGVTRRESLNVGYPHDELPVHVGAWCESGDRPCCWEEDGP